MNDEPNGIAQTLVRRVPIGIWLTIISTIVGFGTWLVRLDARVTENQQRLAAIEATLKVMDEKDTRAGSLVRQKAEHIERAVAWLIANVTGTPGPGPRYYYDPNDPSKAPTLDLDKQIDEKRPPDLQPVPPPSKP